jgi:peptidoglycan/xylan/chitin deacetylase (PgdA/CDA1 family)
MHLKAKIKNFVYLFPNLCGLFTSKQRASILMYHSVGHSGILFNVKPKDFVWQMAYLKNNNFNVISLADLVNLLLCGQEISPKTVVLTLDDGYEDNYFNVFPILRKYNFPATIFLNAGLIGNYYFSRSTNSKFKMLTWLQIRDMHRSGLVDFQPHGITHLKLAEISIEKAKKEIVGSKKIIEEKLGKKCRFFAYPYGSYNREVVEILKRNNFRAAVTVDPGFVWLHDRLFELRRNFVHLYCGKQQFKGMAGLSCFVL